MRKLGFTILFLFLLSTLALCGEISVFLDNQPLPRAKVLKKGGVFYLSLSPVADALGVFIYEKGNQLYLKEKLIRDYFKKEKEFWVSLFALNEALGLWHTFNPETAILDLYSFSPVRKNKTRAISETAPSPAGVSPEKSRKKKKKKTENHPLDIEGYKVYRSGDLEEITCEVRVRNTSEKIVTGAKIQGKFYSLRGRLLGKAEKNISDLNPGQSERISLEITARNYHFLGYPPSSPHYQPFTIPVYCDFKIIYEDDA